SHAPLKIWFLLAGTCLYTLLECFIVRKRKRGIIAAVLVLYSRCYRFIRTVYGKLSSSLFPTTTTTKLDNPAVGR
ncbi:MAG TPA: hypothetical protein VFV86_12315, partial [Nitrososphaeraceae archaeon]|nr:hypothetical protein [Nitrososphaeraceae archaeon]